MKREQSPARVEAHPLPGWWGKLPGMGDFAHRRLPDEFRHAWDHWLQAGLLQLRARHADWTGRYLSAPLWCFMLGDGVIGAGAWMGVLMPSVDAVGRYFPFTVADAMGPGPARLHGPMLAHARHWLERAAQCAIDGLEQDLDALRFDALVLQRFGDGAGTGAAPGEPPLPGDAADGEGGDDGAQDAGEPIGLALPEFGQSLWFTDPAARGGQGMSTLGLPQDEQFDALFGFPAGDVADQ
ncbi:type VI secretion system-associated protein TagF [Variovorax sp.]|uniref:type VI secretion system-associated protein TagF n=1 Tax=Variovorax sp. TaxID=1871043 RepID=UPI002D6BFE1A|nr:type VI secretion system-associated protein TagF [Variovorax sp.]HYP84214.1 type VI secretion system-associated protein TagF [Variovorax sp.]